MNEGVQILIERMKTHPEEFIAEAQYGVSKWGNLIAQYQAYLSQEDRDALDNSYKAVVNQTMQERFTAKIMEELFDPKSENNPYQTANVTHGAGVTQGLTLTVPNGGTSLAWTNATGQTSINANSLTLGNQTLDEATIQHMKAHVEWMKREAQLKQKEKKSKTLFGKLFNYT